MCGYGSADLSCDSQHFSRQCLSWMKVGFPLATIKLTHCTSCAVERMTQ